MVATSPPHELLHTGTAAEPRLVSYVTSKPDTSALTIESGVRLPSEPSPPSAISLYSLQAHSSSLACSLRMAESADRADTRRRQS